MSNLCVKVIYCIYFFSFFTRDVDEIKDNQFYCKTCKVVKTGKLYYNAAFVCRENAYSSKLITLYLSTYDGEAASFFGLPPVDLYRNSTEYQRMKDIIKKLTDKDCYISVIVKAIPTGTNAHDRVYQITGEYENKLV